MALYFRSDFELPGDLSDKRSELLFMLVLHGAHFEWTTAHSAKLSALAGHAHFPTIANPLECALRARRYCDLTVSLFTILSFIKTKFSYLE